MVHLEGELIEGTRLAVTLAQPGSKPMSMRPTLLRVEPGHGFTWLGRTAGIPKIFDGEHSLFIEPIDGHRVRFVHSEKFGGVLLPFLRKMLDTQTRAGFQAMNAALKARAEEAWIAERDATRATLD